MSIRIQRTAAHLAPSPGKYILPGIQNRVAIVNGAASGIGRGICLSLFEQGADVVCVDLKSAEENANETLRVLREARPSGRCTFIACDVLDRSQIESAWSLAEKWSGSELCPTISVSVVGGGVRESFLEQSASTYSAITNLTQHAHWHWQQVAARSMVRHARRKCHLLLIGSVMATMNAERCLPYQAAKAAVASMGRTMAHELASHGINVNVIQPGYIDTPGERKFASDEDIARWPHKYDIPIKRMGTPRDIGATAAFLCSDVASYITGSVLDVDGGYMVAMAMPPRDSDYLNSQS